MVNILDVIEYWVNDNYSEFNLKVENRYLDDFISFKNFPFSICLEFKVVGDIVRFFVWTRHQSDHVGKSFCYDAARDLAYFHGVGMCEVNLSDPNFFKTVKAVVRDKLNG